MSDSPSLLRLARLIVLYQRTSSIRWLRKVMSGPLFRPVIWIFCYWVMWAVLTNRLSTDEPQLAPRLADIRARLDKRYGSERKSSYMAFNKALTWGTAGVGVAVLTAIVTTQKLSPSIWIATICFSLSIPILAVIGLLYTIQFDPPKGLLTGAELILQVIALYAALSVWYVGFAAMLWNFHPGIAAVFIFASYMAWRHYRAIGLKLIASEQDTTAPTVESPPSVGTGGPQKQP